MTSEEIINGNKIIAEFMEAKIHANWGEYLDATYYKKHKLSMNAIDNGVKLSDEQIKENEEIEAKNIWSAKYNSSFDWLVPVVEKLEKLGVGFAIDPYGIILTEYLSGEEKEIYQFVNDDHYKKIDQIYNCVVAGIKWHNENKDK